MNFFRKTKTNERSWLAWPTVSTLGNRRALLLSPRQFEREVVRERIRSTRRSIAFCVVTVELLSLRNTSTDAISSFTSDGNQQSTDGISQPNGRSVDQSRRASPIRNQTRMLVDLLHHNLRTTDDKGILSATRYGVLLTDTPEMGGRSALDRLSGLIAAAGLNARLTMRVHDPEGFGDVENEEFVDQDPRNGRRRTDRGEEKWVRKPVAMTDVGCQAVTAGVMPRSEFEAALTSFGNSVAVLEQPQTDDDRVSLVGGEVAHHSSLLSRTIKRTVDVSGAAVGLLMASPFLFVAMLMIKRTDGGPAMFCQTREGRHGRPFTIYKLRTMIVDAEKSQSALRVSSHRDGPAFKISRDPRVTRIGRFLRASCLDEMPQLINVLKGEMSLVGPRPLPWHESRACQRWHRRRLDVRPGLTCIWQVDKAKAETFDDWMRMDLRYIDRLGFFQDLRLIAKTVIVPVTGRGGE